jgi:hypothetical protein
MSSQEDWPAVDSAIRKRMAELKMTISGLARETGLSETTIRYLARPGQRANRSTLVAISTVLGWRYDYLGHVLLGNRRKVHRLVARSESVCLS